MKLCLSDIIGLQYVICPKGICKVESYYHCDYSTLTYYTLYGIEFQQYIKYLGLHFLLIEAEWRIYVSVI